MSEGTKIKWKNKSDQIHIKPMAKIYLSEYIHKSHESNELLNCMTISSTIEHWTTNPNGLEICAHNRDGEANNNNNQKHKTLQHPFTFAFIVNCMWFANSSAWNETWNMEEKEENVKK